VETNQCVPATPPLLVRRAGSACERNVVTLLREVPVDPGEVAGLVQLRGVFVLCDVTLSPTAPPVAAAAFRPDRPAKTAQLVGIAVPQLRRGRGLGRRLLTGALMVLRAEGFERVQAWAEPGGAAAALLTSAGFAAAGDPAQAGGHAHFVLLL
jgi:GNAT superfamily N-acetyltransferase